MALGRRRFAAVLLALVTAFVLWQGLGSTTNPTPVELTNEQANSQTPEDEFIWRNIKYQYPIKSFRTLPKPSGDRHPKVQAKFPPESPADKETRLKRQKAIKDAFVRSWDTYKKYAWLRDEVTPISGKDKETFGGWGATLIDSIDTLWIMGMRDEFATAVEAVHQNITFTSTTAEWISVFETTIRFLGGLLSAYDLSGDERLLHKARDVGDMLYKAFDTPNHLPVTRWYPKPAANGAKQIASSAALVAEIGSLSLEFTRLSLVTGDPKYYDAVQAISELFLASQKKTKLPGMWPIIINAADKQFAGGVEFTLGGMSDSMYEYLAKMPALLDDKDSIYRSMYLQSVEAAEKHLFYRPMVPGAEDILFSGHVRIYNNKEQFSTKTGHLTCFVGGMLALGGQIMAKPAHVELGGKITRGCIWAYEAMETGVMPEVFNLVSCEDAAACEWNETRWQDEVVLKQDSGTVEEIMEEQRLPKGFTKISDTRYILRPEAIESVFVMYRVTGDPYWREKAWKMWMAIEKLTRTDLAYSAVNNVHVKEGEDAEKSDMMESFWMGETLKYFYLIFSEPDLISLDEWVLNTEAHPFKRLA